MLESSACETGRGLSQPGPKVTADALQRMADECHAEFKDWSDGANADYIPELAKVPPDLFGIAIATVSGSVYAAGDADHTFAMQSLSKPFTVALVMQQQCSAECIVAKVGVEATGLPFNSILATQVFDAVSVNPLFNAGAIASVSMIEVRDSRDRFDAILNWFEQLADARLEMMPDVYESEVATNTRNRAIAYILASAGRVYCDPMLATDVYTRQCSIGITAKQLAIMGATLANGGINPLTHRRVLDPQFVPPVLALMMMAGLYDESGYWAFTTGLPAKTGVGGGMVAVIPGKMAIVGFSPRLDCAGNSVRAMQAVKYIGAKLRANVFESGCRGNDGTWR